MTAAVDHVDPDVRLDALAADVAEVTERVRELAKQHGGPELDPQARLWLQAIAGLTIARTSLQKLAGGS